jgi:hypothetical protein
LAVRAATPPLSAAAAVRRVGDNSNMEVKITHTPARQHPPARPAAAAERPFRGLDRENRDVQLERIAWLVTVGACLIAVLVLVLQGYLGYAAVTFAVAVAAALNLL